MNIEIDFDDTYTADEILFAAWIRLAQERGHDVFALSLLAMNGMTDQITISSERLKCLV